MHAEDLLPSRVTRGLHTAYVGRKVLSFDVTSSTMDEALAAARSGAPEGMVVIADQQSAGRGRFQRSWVSPPGGSLLFSLIMRPSLEVLPKLNMVATLAVVQAVEQASRLKARIKWPNDVQLGGKKACGILVDSVIKEGTVEYAIVGIGLNVNLDTSAYSEIATIATSLSREAGRNFSRLRVLHLLLNAFEVLYEKARAGHPVHQLWSQHLDTLGRHIRIRWGDTVEEGVAEGVEPDGTLVLRRSDGSQIRMVAGEVTIRT